MLVLIDGDPIVYRCGFAAEQTNWHLVYEYGMGEPTEVEFTGDEKGSANDYMKEWLKFNEGRIEILDKQKVVIPDPVSYALRAVKVQVESIIEACEAQFKEGAKMLMWLSGGKNYRDKIATVRPYKGNRDPLHKPVHYAAIREYLQTNYRSFVTKGIEADDAVSIFAHNHYERSIPERLVIATIDKDLDQIPGDHYNYMQKVFYATSYDESVRFFVQQILSGDPTDNIVGCWKCGPAAAARIAGEFSYNRNSTKSDILRRSRSLRSVIAYDHNGAIPAATAPEWWSTVVGTYAASQRKLGCPYAQDNPETVAVEMAQLVKLQEYPGQLWHPRGDLVVPGFGQGDFDE